MSHGKGTKTEKKDDEEPTSMIPKEERENVEENSAAGKEMREQHTVI